MSAVDRHRRQSLGVVGRRSSVHSSAVSANGATNMLSPDIKPGARVLVHSENTGTVRYAGSTSFQSGKWVGVELDQPLGKNNGVVQGKRYFECRANHGVFVRPAHVKIMPTKSAEENNGTTSPRSDRTGDAQQKPSQDPGRAVKAAARRSVTQTNSPQTLAKRRASMAASAVSATSAASERRQSTIASPRTTTTTTNGRRSVTSRTTLTPTTTTPRSTLNSATARNTAANAGAPRATTTTTATNAAARRKSISAKPVAGRPRSNTQGSPSAGAAAPIASPGPPATPAPTRLSQPPPPQVAPVDDPREARERQLQKLRMLQQKQQQPPPPPPRVSSPESLDDDDDDDDDLDDDEDEEDDEVEDDRQSNTNTSSNDDEDEQSVTDKSTAVTPSDNGSPNGLDISKDPDAMNGPQDHRYDAMQEHQQHPQHQQQQRPQAQTYGALAPAIPISKSDQMVPLKDYEELRFKLKILESKRQEDRERYRETEKIKEEAEQFLTLRNKLQDKIAELQRDLRDTKRDLKEAVEDKESYDDKFAEMADNLEMMTLDKEVAEERAEALQIEVDELRDKIGEISVDLDILKREADVLNRVPDSNGQDGEHTALEIVQLERHNERLREALLRLRDVTTENELELNQRIKELEIENYELLEVKAQYDRVKEKLELTEGQIEDLRQRLDDALGAEDLVDQLTEKNMNLTEKLDELQATVDDLEALKELADELEENHVETEKQLQAEIDHRDMLLREQIERLKSAEETNVDYESTIHQFRELVQSLQNDLERLRQKEEHQQSQNVNLTSQSQTMMSLNLQLQSTVMKAQAKSIDLELRKLDAAQANDRLSYIQPYLPDSFLKTDNDPISCLLLFKRLAFKSDLIIKHLDQNHPISEKIMESVSENLVTVCEMRQRAAWLCSLAQRFVAFIRHSKPEMFVKMTPVYHDLIGTERRLNAIVEFFRTEEGNETKCVGELHRVIAHLEHLAEVHLSQPNEATEAGNVEVFFGLTRALDMNADKMVVELTYVKQTVANAVRSEDTAILEGLERFDYEYMEPLGRLVTETKSSKITAKKLMRQLDDLAEQALMPKAEHLHRFKTMHAMSNKLSQFCFETLGHILNYVETQRSNKHNISLTTIQQIVRDRADQILDLSEGSLWEAALRVLKSLSSELATTLRRIENDSKMDKIATCIPPWIQRASDMKAEVVANHDMERRLQQHSEEIVKLIKDIRLKDQLLQESSVKVDLLERRMETAKKEAEQMSQLEVDLQKTREQAQMYSEAMDNLQAEYEALEQENIELKKAAAAAQSDKRVSIPKTPVGFSFNESTEPETDAVEQHDPDLRNQMETLKSGIRYLRIENAYLKSCDLVRSLQLDDAMTQPLTAEHANRKEQEDTRRALATEGRALLKEMRRISASPKLVVLKPRDKERQRRCPGWQSQKSLPDYQYQEQQSSLHTLHQRSEQLRHRVRQLQPVIHDEPQVSKKPSALVEQSMASIAKIKIPRLQSAPSKRHCVQLASAAEFERIHSIFIR
ncbi:dynein associated protein-domain-containing protein [Syncephalastrum racemosum]|uniref:Dynein associated protein-domain-containing protein n=1 Tax=Syncephalastrum racemosum TaxID=13706 RepID=A0A1X2HLQ6_SYNRA|nr:dynein associated protein-domain-containing protein [Syncephalastrum racemosum]